MHMLRKQTTLLSVLLILMLALSACGGGGDAASTAEEPAAETQSEAGTTSTDAEAPAEEPAVSEEEATNEESSGGVWDALGFESRLELLDSYVVTFTYKYNVPGETPQNMEWTQLVNRTQKAIDTTMNSEAAGAISKIRYLSIAETTYMVADAGQCTMINADDIQSESMSPETVMFNNLSDMKMTGSGPDVDGRATDTYVGTYSDGVNKIDATAYVDKEYNVPLQWESKGTTELDGVSQEFEWTYRITELNAAGEVEVPAECAAMTSESTWPMPDDAKVTMQTNEMYVYLTSQPVADVSEFYRNEMPAQGYAVAADPVEMGDMAMLTFSKDNQTISIVISPQDGQTNVVIQVQAN